MSLLWVLTAERCLFLLSPPLCKSVETDRKNSEYSGLFCPVTDVCDSGLWINWHLTVGLSEGVWLMDLFPSARWLNAPYSDLSIFQIEHDRTETRNNYKWQNRKRKHEEASGLWGKCVHCIDQETGCKSICITKNSRRRESCFISVCLTRITSNTQRLHSETGIEINEVSFCVAVIVYFRLFMSLVSVVNLWVIYQCYSI